jgi:desulfoferrodoxin (superoxide reductase-like protein)
MLEKEIKLQEANGVDAAVEKHVPIVKIEEQCLICKAPTGNVQTPTFDYKIKKEFV